MSRANLPPLGIVLTVDDSQALASVRGAYAKLQAEVESRGLKVPLTVTDAGGGRGATFGTPGVAPSLTTSAGFAPNRPVQAGSGYGFNVAPTTSYARGEFNRGAYSEMVAGQLQRGEISIPQALEMTTPAAISRAQREHGLAVRGEQLRSTLARGIFAQTSVMAERGLQPQDIFGGFIQSESDFARSEAGRGDAIRARAFAHAGLQSRRQDQLDMRAMHARRTHALRNALPGGWGGDLDALDEASAMEERGRGRAIAEEAEDEAERARKARGNRRGFFDRPSSNNIRFISTIAALETANIVGAVNSMSNPLLNRNAMQTMQTQEQSVLRLQSGLVGSVVGGVLGALDSASISRGYAVGGAARGFGILGRYSPLAMQAAQIGAEEGIAGMQAGTEAIGRIGAARITAGQLEGEAGIIRERSGFRRRRMAALERVNQAGAAMDAEATDLQQQMLDADAVGDTAAVNRLNRRLQTNAKTAPGLVDAMWKRFHAEYEATNRDRDLERNAINRSGRALRSQIGLQFGRASEQAFESGLETELENADPELQGQIGAQQGLQRGARLAGINEDIRRRQVQTSSILMRSQGKPYSAAVSELGEQRKQALQNARFGTFDVFGLSLSFDERPSINAEYDAREKALGADRVRETRLLQLGLGGRAAQLRALSDPTMRGGNVIGAQAIGIATQGHIQAEQFRQQERPVQAGEALRNALSEESLLKKTYTESFRAVQFDTRENFFAPRDQENVGKTLKSIEDEIRGLRQDLQVED